MMSVVACLLCLFVSLMVPLSAGANLVVNGDAETGDIDGWTADPPDEFATSSSQIHDGEYSFHAGVFGPVGSYSQRLWQDIDLTPYSTDIDAGLVTAVFSGWGQSRQNQNTLDDAEVWMTMSDGIGGETYSYASGALRPTNEWVAFGVSQSVPVGTKAIRIMLQGSRDFGISTDGFFDDIRLELEGLVTGVQADESPAESSVSVFPTPFNPSTSITLELKDTGMVNLVIYDAAGRVIDTIHRGHLSQGIHVFTWGGTDIWGKGVAAGTYLCVAEQDGRRVASVKMLLAP